MKRLGLLFFALTLTLALPAAVPAAEETPAPAAAQAPAGEDDAAAMKQMMARKLITKSDMVATSDGGVVVRAGATLLKFDGSLKLVGTADIPADRISTAGMAPSWGHGMGKGHGMHCCQMAGGMANCPIHGQATQAQQSASPAEDDDD